MPEGRRAWRPGGKNLILCGVLTRSIATKEAAPDGGKVGAHCTRRALYGPRARTYG